MIIKSNIVSIYTFIVFLIFLFLLNERLYLSYGEHSGIYNSYVSMIIVLALLLGCFFCKTVFSLQEIILFILIVSLITLNGVVKNGYIEETARYLINLSIIFLSSKFHFSSLPTLAKIIIIDGLVCHYLFPTSFIGERATGFFLTTPTNFSLIILISIVIIIESMKHTNQSFESVLFFCLVSLYLIYASETRSVLLFFVLYLFYKLVRQAYRSESKGLRILVIALFLLIIPFSYSFVLQLVNQRTDGYASTSTRLLLYEAILTNLRNHPVSWFFGNGTGTAYNLTISMIGIKFPPHFDFLAILHDLGIVMIIGGTFFFKRIYNHLYLVVIGLVILANFHNLIFFPIGLTYICMLWSYLDYLNDL
ncbi:O-antigen ligase family protein [Candidatus Enterococcus moelleringii]|uniref:O-antigen ligase family protein n=1 Tax=Candidatus Enterococcus moelleringii TaxID=2815325 RepID=UPI003D345BA6